MKKIKIIRKKKRLNWGMLFVIVPLLVMMGWNIKIIYDSTLSDQTLDLYNLIVVPVTFDIVVLFILIIAGFAYLFSGETTEKEEIAQYELLGEKNERKK